MGGMGRDSVFDLLTFSDIRRLCAEATAPATPYTPDLDTLCDRVEMLGAWLGWPEREVEIGARGSGVVFDTQPVELTSEVNDTLDVLFTRGATVRLLSGIDLSPLFSATGLETTAVVRDAAGAVVFAGFLEPQAYSQPWNEMLDEVSLSCIDALSALQYYRYKGAGLGGFDWASARLSCVMRPLRGILSECLAPAVEALSGTVGLSLSSDASRRLREDDARDALDALTVSEDLFMGDTEADVWTCQEVMEEVLRYLNLHAELRGGEVRVFSLAELGRRPAREITSREAADTDATVETGPAYNVVKLSVDAKEVEAVIDSPLDKDRLASPYPSRQLYLTEAQTLERERGSNDRDKEEREKTERAEKDDATAIRWLSQLYDADLQPLNGLRGQDAGSEESATEHYMRYLTCAGWEFPTTASQEVRDYVAGCVSRADRQYSTLDALNAQVYEGNARVSAGLFSFASRDFLSKASTAPENDLSDEPCLMIGLTGVLGDSTDTEHTAPTYSAGVLGKDAVSRNLVACAPIAVYTGGGTAAGYSPADNATTNYIVFSGSICLDCRQETPLRAPIPLIGGYTDRRILQSYIESSEPLEKAQDAMKRRLLTRRWWKFADTTTRPTVDNLYPDRSDPEFARFSSDEEQKEQATGAQPFTGKNAKRLEVGRRVFALGYGSTAIGHLADPMWSVPVLACVLVIGDKCLVESRSWVTGPEGGREERSWRWEPWRGLDVEDPQCFYLGVDPKQGEWLVGEGHDITNNVRADTGLPGVSGTAIPVRREDNLRGRVQFYILGPVNVFINTKTLGPTTLLYTKWHNSPWELMEVGREPYETTAAPEYDWPLENEGLEMLLNHVGYITVRNFEVKVHSDNARRDLLSPADLMYISDTDERYANAKDDLTFRLCSGLTEAEAAEAGSRSCVSLSSVIDTEGNAICDVWNADTGEQGKPEKQYVDAVWREWHKPRTVWRQKIWADGGGATYTTASMPGKTFMEVGRSRDLAFDTDELILKEIADD